MGTVDVLPDGTVSNSGYSVVGAASAHAALSDASDASYITDNITGQHAAKFSFATTTLPSGAVIKKITPKFRASQASGNQRIGPLFRVYWPTDATKTLYGPADTWQRPTSSIADFTNNTAGPAYLSSPDPAHPNWTPQFLVDNLQCSINTSTVDTSTSATDDHRVYKLWLTIEYNEQPVATSLALDPAGANTTTTKPGFTWVCSDPEGDLQAGRRVVLWLTTDFNDLNCPDANGVSFVATDGSTRTAVAHTGTATDPTEYSASNSWVCPVDLTATGGYTLCVQLADQVGDQVRFANSAGTGTFGFTMAITPPPTPVLSAVTWNQPNYRTSMLVQAANNALDADTADHEIGAASWTANTNASGVTTVSSPTAFNGTFSRRWTAVATADSNIGSGFFACAGSSAYSFHYRGRSGAASRNHQIVIGFYDAAQAPITFMTSPSTAVNNSGWTEVKYQNVVSPSNARFFKIFTQAVGSLAGEFNYNDAVGAYPGTTSPATWTRGGLVDSQRVVVERSVDSGLTWTVLPQCSGLTGGVLTTGDTNQLRGIYDLATRHNVPATYRAKTTHTDGTNSYQSAYSSTGGPVSPSFDQLVLRDPTDSALLTTMHVTGPIEMTSVERVGVFEVLFVAAPVFVSQIVGTERLSIPVRFVGETEWANFKLLRKKMTTLILQTDMDGVAWWVRFGPTVSSQLAYSTLRKAAATRPRFASLELLVSNGPAGQPAEVP